MWYRRWSRCEPVSWALSPELSKSPANFALILFIPAPLSSWRQHSLACSGPEHCDAFFYRNGESSALETAGDFSSLFILSGFMAADYLREAARARWNTNSIHGIFDITFGQDPARYWIGNRPRASGNLSHFALIIPRQALLNRSAARKIKFAGYLPIPPYRLNAITAEPASAHLRLKEARVKLI